MGDRHTSASGNTVRVRTVKERGERYVRKGGKDGGMVSIALFSPFTLSVLDIGVMILLLLFVRF